MRNFFAAGGITIPYTTLKHLSVQAQAANSGTWGAGGTTGDDLNTGVMGPIDTMLAGISTFSVSGATIALTFVAGGGGSVQNCMWRFTGALLQNAVASPDAGDATTYLNGFYYFENVTTGSFTITVTTGVGSAVLPQGRRGCLFIDGTNGPRIVAIVGSSTADPVPAGSSTIWYNTAAPSGWTAVALNDYAVQIVTNGLGGVTSGSVLYSTLFGRTEVDGHAISIGEMPAHTHGYNQNSAAFAAQGAGSPNTYANSQVQTSTTSVGGGAVHTHGLDTRVFTAAFTLATRN